MQIAKNRHLRLFYATILAALALVIAQACPASEILISETEARRPSPQELETFFKSTKQGFVTHDEDGLFKSAIHRENEKVQQRIIKLLSRMSEEDRILIVSDDVLERRGFCEKLECQRLRAFYLPLKHQIFIRESSDLSVMSRSLYHELYHAYQFVYRWPIDVGSLATMKMETRLLKTDAALYLDYFYEAQANWKAMIHIPDRNWEKTFRNSTRDHLKTILLFFAGGGFTHLATKTKSNTQANKFLPRSLQLDPNLSISPMGATAALAVPELIVVDQTKTRLNLTGRIDFPFHAKYGRAIEETYFGKLPFLFSNNRDDLKIFNTLHDRYYAQMSRSPLDTVEACKSIIEFVQSKAAPIVAWTTLTDMTLSQCPAYANSSSQEDRLRMFTHSLEGGAGQVERSANLSPTDPNANSSTTKDGTDGTKPVTEKEGTDGTKPYIDKDGTDGTKPLLNIMPQYEILPPLQGRRSENKAREQNR